MLQEISVGYDPDQDRIQLRLRSREGDADVLHRLWLTRRITLSFHAGLSDLVSRSAQVPASLPEPARQHLVAGHHHARLQQSTIQTEKRQPADHGEVPPRLVLRALCGAKRSGGQWAVRFECETGEPLTLALSERTLHALAASIDDRMRRAAWLTAAAPALAKPPPSDGPPAGLH